MKSLITCFAVCIFVTASAVIAQSTRPKSLTRVYDIRDMLMTVPNFPYEGKLGLPQNLADSGGGGGGGGGGGQSLFGGGQAKPTEGQMKERQERAAAFIRLITESVEPESWREAGGNVGSIREMHGLLIVTHTPDVHQLVASVLKQLREGHGLVRVQADWVLLTPDQLGELFVASKAGDAPRIIDRAALNKLMAGGTYYRAEISCFDGQTVSIESGRSRSMVFDGEPVVAQSAAAVNPDMRQVNSGVMLEVTPMIIIGAETAIVQVRSAVAEWSEPEKAELTYSSSQPGGSNVQGPAAIDRLNVLRQELRTALRIPLNQPVLVGGMTLEPTVTEPQSAQLYLILQVSSAR